MTGLLIVIYIAFVSLGFPDSLFGVSWPVVHVEFGTPESFASLYSILTGICTGGAYGTGFFIQLVYGYVASATTFAITPFVLLALGFGVIGATVITLKALKNKETK